MTREAIHRLVATVLGQMSLALARPGSVTAVHVRRWVADLRRAADALEARIAGDGR